MKRLDIEPTTEKLIEAIKTNRAGRNGDIVDFIRMLAETEGPYSYMVDASWGDGKTFFVKSVALVLEAMNPNISSPEPEASELKGILDELADTNFLALPFYFNAWENDYSDDPLTTLFASMAAEFDRKDLLNNTGIKVVEGIAAVIDMGLAIAQVPFRTSGITSSISSKSLIESHKKRDEIRERINEIAEKSIIEVANKLVIFVD